MYYYYDAENNYVGCGNEAEYNGMTGSTEPPVFPEPHAAEEVVVDPVDKLKAFLAANPDVLEIL